MIVSIPSVETIFASSSASAGQIFNEFWPYMLIALGIFLGALIVVWLARNLSYVFNIIFGPKLSEHDKELVKKYYGTTTPYPGDPHDLPWNK